MHIDNNTGRTAGYTLGMDPDGGEHVVLAVKGSFDFPDQDGAICPPADTSDALILADEFWGEPGYSAPRTEMDFAPVKQRCDILLDATAHAPGGRPAERVKVGVRIGNWSKVIDVIGNRAWVAGVAAPGISGIRPFRTMPITYDVAFGGIDRLDPDEALPDAYLPNPVGRGWHKVSNQGRLTGAPLPNTEAPDDPVTVPWGTNRAMSFGPIGRGWPERLRYAGTYDQAWIDDVFPFLPKDFDTRYYQAAPEDQQIPHPGGGEPVTLVNLTAEGRTTFRLPPLDLPVVFVRKRKEDVPARAVADTIVIQPDRRRLNITWRASLPLENDIFEVPQCIVGQRSRGFWRARALGKTFYPSLKELVAASSKGGSD